MDFNTTQAKEGIEEIASKLSDLVDDAEEENVKFYFLALPTKLITVDNKIVGIEVQKMELGEPDDSGRRRPVPVEGSETLLDVDTIIAAIGQKLRHHTRGPNSGYSPVPLTPASTAPTANP